MTIDIIPIIVTAWNYCFYFQGYFFSTHLLQRRVRHTKAAEADVQESFLQLPEKASISPGLEVTIG